MGVIRVKIDEEIETTKVLEYVEKHILHQLLEITRWNRLKTAMLLGVSRGTIHNKIKQYWPDKEEIIK